MEEYGELGMRALAYLIKSGGSGLMHVDDLTNHLGLAEWRDWFGNLTWLDRHGLLDFKGVEPPEKTHFKYTVTPLGRAKAEEWRLQRAYPPLSMHERESIERLATWAKEYLLELADAESGSLAHVEIARSTFTPSDDSREIGQQLVTSGYVYTNSMHAMLKPAGKAIADLIKRQIIEARTAAVATPDGRPLTEKLLRELAEMGSQPPIRLAPIRHQATEMAPQPSELTQQRPQRIEPDPTPPPTSSTPGLPQSVSNHQIGAIHAQTVNYHVNHGSEKKESFWKRMQTTLGIIGGIIAILTFFGVMKYLRH